MTIPVQEDNQDTGKDLLRTIERGQGVEPGASRPATEGLSSGSGTRPWARWTAPLGQDQ